MSLSSFYLTDSTKELRPLTLHEQLEVVHDDVDVLLMVFQRLLELSLNLGQLS